MNYFIIRHIPTGFIMPQHDKKRGGFTHDEPQDPKVHPPRMFTSEKAAKCALTWWLKGVTSVNYIAGDVFAGIDWDEDWHTEPITEEDQERYGMVERKEEDMEIVSVAIVNCRNPHLSYDFERDRVY